MVDEAKLDSLSEALRLLLSDNKLVFPILLNAEGRVPDNENVAGDARHNEVMQMVVEGNCTFLQPWIRLYFHFIPIARWQSDNLARVAYILDELVGCFTQVEDFSWQENSNHLLEVRRELFF